MAMVACAQCGRPVPVGARFCPSCGGAVASPLTALEERRVVTVLFADLVGYTALAEHLDPERVKRLIEACFERLVADIEAYGGRVDKLLGDAILALFGAPVAHEDDAERAVRAALRLQETLARFVAERSAAGGVDGAPVRLADGTDAIQMRVGINTGEVLVGTLAGTDYTAMGDVVNTASRLQSMAPPGGILIGSATAALCSPAIIRQPFGVAQIRGRSQLEESWLITGASGVGSRPIRGDVPFVGRTHERVVLDSAVAMVRGGRSGVVSIVGEPGAGKTRLADEVVAGLAGEATVLRASCSPYGEASVWAPVASALSSLFSFGPEATAEAMRNTVEARAGALWSLSPGDAELDRYLGAVDHLLGLPSDLDRLDPAGAKDRFAGLLAEMMRRHAQTRMTVLVLDNLQWADPLIRDLLAVVVRSLSDLPLLVITAERPDEDLEWPPPHLERSLVLRLPLGPLDRADACALVRAIIERDRRDEPQADSDVTIDESVVEDLVDRGGGNPLFLVELATLAAHCDSGTDLPGSLRALIAARLDQLPLGRRAIVENAAVLGASDSVGSLERFAREMRQEFLVADMDALVADGIFDLDGGWWQFRSDVVREVAYQTLTKRTRAQRHAGVAMVLKAYKEHQIEDRAHHAASAAELVAELGPVEGVPRAITAEAVEALHAAAAAAIAAGHSDHAARHATRALDLGTTDSPTERRLLLIRASAQLDQRHFPGVLADAGRALELAVAAADRVDEGEARRRLGTAAYMRGDLAIARAELNQAVAVFRDQPDDAGHLADALRARGFAEVFGGSLADARRFLDEAMDIFHRIDDERGHAWTHHNLAWVAFQSGDFEAAERELTEACERFEALGDQVGVNWAQGLRAYVLYFQRHFDEAEELASAITGEARRWGDTWAALMMQSLLANLRLWTGRLAEAEQLAERALAGFKEVDDHFGVMQALSPLSRARAGLGKVADAQRGSEESVALGHSFGELGLALQGAAAVALHLGEPQRALILADQVIERNRTTGAVSDEILVVRSVALCQLGRFEEALAAIEPLDVEDFPFGQAARAVVRALNGDGAGAVADAEAVEKTRGPSYFDLGMSRLGATLGAGVLGDESLRQRWLERLSTTAATAGDVVFVGLAQELSDDDRSAVGAGPAASPGPGWRRIVAPVLTAD
ncbi:MAG: AAA family ATPase [Acidimicrobiia bacterium]|nr:AAA family ATPase [Acidimicrobiia bacterium]